MQITRLNYEQYMLDYLEGTLPLGEMERVRMFLRQNPDLAEQMDATELVRLPEPRNMTFPGKAALLKPETEQNTAVARLLKYAALPIAAMLCLFAALQQLPQLQQPEIYTAGEATAVRQSPKTAPPASETEPEKPWPGNVNEAATKLHDSEQAAAPKPQPEAGKPLFATPAKTADASMPPVSRTPSIKVEEPAPATSGRSGVLAGQTAGERGEKPAEALAANRRPSTQTPRATQAAKAAHTGMNSDGLRSTNALPAAIASRDASKVDNNFGANTSVPKPQPPMLAANGSNPKSGSLRNTLAQMMAPNSEGHLLVRIPKRMFPRMSRKIETAFNQ